MPSLILCWLASPPRLPDSLFASRLASSGPMRRVSPGDEKVVSFTSNSPESKMILFKVATVTLIFLASTGSILTSALYPFCTLRNSSIIQ